MRSGACAATVAGQRRGEPGVDLQGHDPPDDRQEGEGQRAQPGADLDDGVVGAHAGDAHDAAHGVAVDDEVLPPVLRGPDAVAGRELADLARPEQGVVAGIRHGHTLAARAPPQPRATAQYVS